VLGAAEKTQEKHLKAIFFHYYCSSVQTHELWKVASCVNSTVGDSSMVALNRHSALLKFSVFVKS